MKIITWYLPQFHEIEENNKWWGKGFTEWTNVRKAESLFKGHHQPRKPLNGHYYDLTKVESLEWQAKLAREYNIYGFCFYHYWFSGKLLLEKPMELLLKNKHIDLNYCISWANEPWTRSWDGKTNEVLISQNYGQEENWSEHFNYLLPFFLDERYIKVNNKPMVVIYKSQSIPNCEGMMNYFIKQARKYGFDGLHFVETIRSLSYDERSLPFEARVEFEPARTSIQMTGKKWKNRFRRALISTTNKLFKLNLMGNAPYDYVEFYKKACSFVEDKRTYPGVFVGWDNTPRRGNMGTVYLNCTPEHFSDYLNLKMKNADFYNTDFLFINAWNEWCEGAYLEPDELNGYKYLEVLKTFKEKCEG